MYTHGKNIDVPESNASVNIDVTRRAEFVLDHESCSWTSQDEKKIERFALHEVLHVLLFDLVVSAEDRFATSDEIDTAVHGIIRRLERAFIGEVVIG